MPFVKLMHATDRVSNECNRSRSPIGRRSEAHDPEVAGISPPQPLTLRPPDTPPPPLIVPSTRATPGVRQAIATPSRQAPQTTAHVPTSGAQSAGGSSSNASGQCAAPEARHDGPAVDGQSLQQRCASADIADDDGPCAASDTTGPPRWDDMGLASDDPAVTHLLTQRFMPNRQIAAIRADGSITIWREDGGRHACFRLKELAQPLSLLSS